MSNHRSPSLAELGAVVCQNVSILPSAVACAASAVASAVAMVVSRTLTHEPDTRT